MRQDAGPGGSGVQMVDHVLHEGEVGLGLRSQFTIRAEAIVILMNSTGGPVGGEGGIGENLGQNDADFLRGVELAAFFPAPLANWPMRNS